MTTIGGGASPMSYWLGVVSRDHVRRALQLGIGQIGHGKRGGLARLHAGDWLIYYSPRTSLDSTRQLRAFTAIGQVEDDDVWQADEGDFKPWRRRVNYLSGGCDAPVQALLGSLDLTSKPNWGYQLRRGLVELSKHDFHVIRAAMQGN